ncbi:MAG: hypothetical protein A2W22_02155 [Candidatus Levybacteria bacterium RBG_16_35_11]|nr:MAG: hypothetical protein A2W22_02155 [Candidatus Levybacteria bacterium RBG_16_35_11]
MTTEAKDMPITLSEHHYRIFWVEVTFDVEYDGRSIEEAARRYTDFNLHDSKKRYEFLRDPEAYEKSVQATTHVLKLMKEKLDNGANTIEPIHDTYLANDGSRQWSFDWLCENGCGNFLIEDGVKKCRQMLEPPPDDFEDNKPYMAPPRF